MELTRRDLVATVLVAAIVVPYAGYLIRGDMPFIHDARGMAATALGLGLAACAFGGAPVRGSGLAWLGAVLSTGTLGLGVAAFATQNEGLLGATVAGVVVLWLMTTTRHAVRDKREPTSPRATAHVSKR